MSRENRKEYYEISRQSVKDAAFAMFLILVCFTIKYATEYDIFKKITAYLTK